MDLYRLQSEEMSAGSHNVRTQENLKFVDAGLSKIMTAPSLGPFRPDSDSGAELASFLSRPVQISSFDWTSTNNNVVQLGINPWQLYFNDPAIKKKLDNFARIRCKLHLKFVVNASPFYYGLMRACYTPLLGHDLYVSAQDQIKFSQTPGVYLEPANMNTAELELPFFWPNAWLDATVSSDFANMGRLTYVLYAGLQSANAVATASVRVVCYAWATDVEVAGLTTLGSLQSDEYDASGSISGPAIAIAEMAGSLSQAPVIGKLATATEIGARAVASVARAFGFSNPPVIDDVHPYAPKAFHSFSSVDTSYPSDKLTIDPKNEVTVDSSVTGYSDEDQLLISSLVRRESFIQGSAWSQTNTEGTILWSAPVTPMMVAQTSVSPQTVVNHTPAAYVGRSFSLWRGSITYRFKLVKSRYHTGRLLISWDPVQQPGADYETTTLTRVVDLQSEDEVTITIPYKSRQAWLRTTTVVNRFSNGPSPTFAVDPYAENGVIQVRVLTTLTGPAANANIGLLAYVSCGEDFRFAVPNELPTGLSTFALQSTDIVCGDTVPADMVSDAVAQPSGDDVEIVTTGESIKSLRALLHRSSLADVQFAGEPRNGAATYWGNGYKFLVNYFPRIPLGYGYNPDSYTWATRPIATGNGPFNFAPNHPINWFLNCFAGYRGSIVHHFNVDQNGASVPSIAAEGDRRKWNIEPTRNGRNRGTTNIDLAQSTGIATITTNLFYSGGVRGTSIGQRGMALTNAMTQAGVSVVSPQYSMWRFRAAYEPYRNTFNSLSQGEDESVRLTVTTRCGDGSATGVWPIVHHYVAGGVDFSPVFFVCTPTLYAYTGTGVDNYTP